MSRDPMWPHSQRVMCHYGLSSPHYKSPSCQIWWSEALCKMKYFAFGLPLDLMCLRGQIFARPYRRVSLIISDYPKKFDNYRPWGDIKVSVCHVTSHDRVVRGSSNMMGEFPSLEVTALLILVVTGFVELEILSF